ncbi:hypothetical protein FB381_2786 [Nocardioides albertanoniae]|uniref:ECF transporter S component n=1 Tax=Nocardioides albertanoniae TaxID=1175486 RepID=A0A543A8H3_9ACTN|nr:hypothetical protein [Nocardioides albertanoniae]TQL68887.1 hypothetical protein FB381_2786 [Nocardioides albertanoniae]
MARTRRGQKKSAAERQLSKWTRRRILSTALFAAAGLVAVQHLLAHGGFQPLPISMGWQDLLVGYPMAILLAIGGGIAMDPDPGA